MSAPAGEVDGWPCAGRADAAGAGAQCDHGGGGVHRADRHPLRHRRRFRESGAGGDPRGNARRYRRAHRPPAQGAVAVRGGARQSGRFDFLRRRPGADRLPVDARCRCRAWAGWRRWPLPSAACCAWRGSMPVSTWTTSRTRRRASSPACPRRSGRVWPFCRCTCGSRPADEQFAEPILVAAWLLGIAFLMISSVPTLSWSKLRPRRQHPAGTDPRGRAGGGRADNRTLADLDRDLRGLSADDTHRPGRLCPVQAAARSSGL